MKRLSFPFILMAAVSFTLILLSAGCKKSTTPGTPANPRTVDYGKLPDNRPAAEPTVTISANPVSIERGRNTTLTWETTNANEVSIDNGLGTVEAAGSRSVRPLESTTYRIRATNNVAIKIAEVRVTVSDDRSATPPTTSVINDIPWFIENMQDIFFDLDDYAIRGDARLILQENARRLLERPGIFITIEGHCDERGSERYNLVLGDRRANAARDYLITLGVAANRIETISYGEERQFCEASTEECWQLNRRASFVMR